ncbi:MAG: pyridoxamine 5'-phosphate oxidase family protein [Planctomycetota bacterium]
MSRTIETITPELADWIHAQKLFFVATAPASLDGHVNCSPKGLDSLRVLGPHRAAYLDHTGSGSETIAHVRENGRIVLMFCAFTGPPKIVRLHGRGAIVLPGTTEWKALAKHFPKYDGARSIVTVDVTRISESCGLGVPEMEVARERRMLQDWAKKRGKKGIREYQELRNAASIDGLPSLGAEGSNE